MKRCVALFAVTSAIAAMIFAGCSSVEDKAALRLNHARMVLQNQDTVQALLHLDSVEILHPKAAYSVSSAKNLKREIAWEMLQHREKEKDSVEARIVALEQKFIPGKSPFGRNVVYTHKNQVPENRLSNSFLQILTDDKGNLTLISNYYGGQWLEHTRIRVYDGDLEAKTDSVPLGNIDNYRGNFLDARWERVTFRNGRDKGVIELIAANPGKKLKAVYIGKRNQFIILEDRDKEAAKDAFDLSRLIKNRERLTREISELQFRTKPN